MEVFYTKNPYNFDKLNEEIQTSFPLAGLSDGVGGVRVSLPDGTGQATIDAIGVIVANHDASDLTEEQELHNERAGILAKAELAVVYMPDLKKILNTAVDNDIASANLATRFASLSSVVDTQVSSAFKNRFNEALKQEQNIDVVAIGLGSLTVNQQRTYLTYLRIFHNQYTTLALFGSINV